MLLRSLLTVAGSAAILVASAHAGCKSCQANAPAVMAPIPLGASSAPVTMHGPAYGTTYGASAMYGSWAMGGGYGSTGFGGQHPFRSYRSDHTPYAGGGVRTIAPPPGTIGQTYQLPSAPVPATMHPRTAVLKVLAETAVEVEVMSTNPMRAQDEVEGHRDEETGVWVFKTDPLIPGNAHIYRVRAKYGDGMAHQDRYVRMIRGRVVALSY